MAPSRPWNGVRGALAAPSWPWNDVLGALDAKRLFRVFPRPEALSGNLWIDVCMYVCNFCYVGVLIRFIDEWMTFGSPFGLGFWGGAR